MALILNLGCGSVGSRPKPKPGEKWIHIDKNPGFHPTLVHDLDEGLPMYKDGSVDEILCRGVIQYLEDPIAFLNECWRVLRDDGEFRFAIPLVDLNLTAAFSGITFRHHWSSEALERILAGNAWYDGFKGKFERIDPASDDGRMRFERWKVVK